MKLKITGYTILFFIIFCILSYWITISEIYLYEKCTKLKDYTEIIAINIMGITILFVILWFADLLDPLDRLLKKRIL